MPNLKQHDSHPNIRLRENREDLISKDHEKKEKDVTS